MFKCATVTCYLKSFIGVSCLLVFVVTTVAGLILIIAPEEPSLELGGGSAYSLYTGIGLLVISVLVALLAVSGCVCVIKDTRVGLCLLSGFLLILGLLVIGSVSTLFTFTHTGVISSQLNNTLWNHLQSNRSSDSILFEIQANYSCCGVDDPSDWYKNPKWSSNDSLPSSCCEDAREGESCDIEDAFSRGCKDVLMHRLQLVVNISFSTAAVGFILLVITACLAGYGSCLITKYQNYDIL